MDTREHAQNSPFGKEYPARNKCTPPKVIIFMKRVFWFVTLFAIGGVLGARLVQPATAVRQATSAAPILTGARTDAHVFALLERSCQNCHSLKTEWPLYSRVFPFSWIVEHDVQTARTRMNLSRWDTYDNSEKSLLLSEIGSVVRNRVMPPRRYTIVHSGAKLSDADASAIYQWTRAERRWLNGLPEDDLPEE
jgi:hypothetical protein